MEVAMSERLLHALLGAFLGGLIAFLSLYLLFDGMIWLFVSISAVVCAVISFLWGESFLEWLKSAVDFWP